MFKLRFADLASINRLFDPLDCSPSFYLTKRACESSLHLLIGVGNGNGRTVRRFVANQDDLLDDEFDGRNIWSKAPVVGEDDFEVKERKPKVKRESRKTAKGHVNVAFQRSRSEHTTLVMSLGKGKNET